jgi:YidC/Oxa1 family membrane protein insertase
MEKRTILAIVLAFAVVMIYQYFFVKPLPPKQPGSVQQEGQKTVEPAAPKQPVAAAPAQVRTPTPKPSVPGQDIAVDTPLYTAVFNTRGAGIKSFKLKEYRKTLAGDSELIELVEIKEGMAQPLSITFPESSIQVPHDEHYKADRSGITLAQAQDSGKLTFSVSYPEGARIEKTFTFYGDKYRFDLDVKVYNNASLNLNQKAFLSWNQYVDPKMEEDSYGHLGPIFDIKGNVDTENVKKMDTRKVLGPQVSWGAFESKYFIAAMIPKQPSLTSLVMSKDVRDLVTVSLEGPGNVVPTGQSAVFSYALYLGPKEYKNLQAEGVGLENAIDFGSWIKWLALPLLIALNFLYKFVHNYGIAIIIITIATKIIFWPLGNKSYKSMKDMQKVQPRITELREQYKNDKARLNQEVMQLYKTHKINPLGGCLPILIQIPVFFGLYKTLLYSIELRHSPFVFWIQDLSAKDPYYITPIIMGATMFWQQKMTPSMGDPMQQKLMLIMPVIFTFLFLNFPSGLVIYWLFNNILSIGQQYYINKTLS